jgi:hypothetical protein
MPRSAPAVAQAPAAAPAPAAAVVTPAQLTTLEDRVLAQMRAELDSHTRLVSTERAPRNGSESNAETADLARRVNVLTARQNDLYDRVLEFASETQDIRVKQTGLERRTGMLVSYMGQAGVEGAGGR